MKITLLKFLALSFSMQNLEAYGSYYYCHCFYHFCYLVSFHISIELFSVVLMLHSYNVSNGFK